MIRPALLAAIALGFLTALVASQLGWMLAGSSIGPGSEPIPAHHARPIVEAFYTGVNRWIAEGDRALVSVLAPDFVDHSMSGAPDRDASQLFEHLNAIQSAAPELQFEIVSIEGDGAVVAVDLLGTEGAVAPVPGWTLELSGARPSREILRLERGHVAERWARDDLWPTNAISFDFDRPLGGEIFRLPAIQRFTLDADLGSDLTATDTVVLWVESGALVVDLSGRDAAGTLRYPTEPMLPGDLRIVNADSTLPVRSQGEGPTVFWTVSLDTILVPRIVPDSAAFEVASDVQVDTIVSVPVKLPEPDVRLSVSFRTIPAGAQLVADPVSMTALAVVDGQIDAEPVSGIVAYCFGRTRSRPISGVETATAGQGFAAQYDSSANYQAAVPTTVILLSIIPSPSGSTPALPIRISPG